MTGSGSTAAGPSGPVLGADETARPPPDQPAPPQHVRYAEAGTATGSGNGTGPPPLSPSTADAHAPPSLHGAAPGSVSSPIAPGFRRRMTRASTFRNVESFAEYEVRPGWQPGAEPGIDTSKPDGGRETLALRNTPSDITVVDFSQASMQMTRLDNATLADFLAQPQPPGMTCRWINVNGLSWDVIQILGNHKNLHHLAIEDLINTRNRTKADWYATHAYMVLTLQKLVHVDEAARSSRRDDGDDDRGGDTDDAGASFKSASSKSHRASSSFQGRAGSALRGLFGGWSASSGGGGGGLSAKSLESGAWARPPNNQPPSSPDDDPGRASPSPFRTLQRYHASPNDVRTDFMERHSALSSRSLAVAAEQVSIFITNDNTALSFFELSADDVEQPILKRLRLPDTSLRRSCDASMVAQAILDAIIDLAIPVTRCYSDVVADLELDVLTRPSVNHTKSLYITITEINKVLSFINPVMNLITTLRDHKADKAAIDDLRNPDLGVIISPTTYVYLSDVLDHCVLIIESLDQIRGQAENMISLIFNTISAYQNESMKQLTVVTIIFLPLTFLTGYFGQNFDNFSDLRRGIPFFWQIAAPVIFFTIVIMMYDMIIEYCKSFVQRRHIVTLRNHHRRRIKK